MAEINLNQRYILQNFLNGTAKKSDDSANLTKKTKIKESDENLISKSLEKYLKDFALGQITYKNFEVFMLGLGAVDFSQTIVNGNIVQKFTVNGKKYEITSNKEAADSGTDKIVDKSGSYLKYNEGSQTNTNDFANKYNVNGKRTESIYYNNKGQITSEIKFNNDNEKIGYISYSYDDKGNVKKETIYNYDKATDKNIAQSQYVHNADGTVTMYTFKNGKTYPLGTLKDGEYAVQNPTDPSKTTKSDYKDSNGNKIGTYEYERNANGKVTVRKRYDLEGNLTQTYSYVYDNNGKISKYFCVNYKDDGSYSTTTYNAKNKAVESTSYNMDNQVISHTDYSYNEKNVKIGQNTTNYDLASGKVQSKYVYAFNNDGNKTGYTVEKYDTDTGKVKSSSVYSIENGKTSGCTTINYDLDSGKVKSKYAYEYNNGKTSGCTAINYDLASGKVKSEYVYSYDKDGSKTGYTQTDYNQSTGKAKKTTVYKYDKENNKNIPQTQYVHNSNGTVTMYTFDKDGKTKNVTGTYKESELAVMNLAHTASQKASAPAMDFIDMDFDIDYSQMWQVETTTTKRAPAKDNSESVLEKELDTLLKELNDIEGEYGINGETEQPWIDTLTDFIEHHKDLNITYEEKSNATIELKISGKNVSRTVIVDATIPRHTTRLAEIGVLGQEHLMNSLDSFTLNATGYNMGVNGETQLKAGTDFRMTGFDSDEWPTFENNMADKIYRAVNLYISDYHEDYKQSYSDVVNVFDNVWQNVAGKLAQSGKAYTVDDLIVSIREQMQEALKNELKFATLNNDVILELKVEKFSTRETTVTNNTENNVKTDGTNSNSDITECDYNVGAVKTYLENLYPDLFASGVLDDELCKYIGNKAMLTFIENNKTGYDEEKILKFCIDVQAKLAKIAALLDFDQKDYIDNHLIFYMNALSYRLKDEENSVNEPISATIRRAPGVVIGAPDDPDDSDDSKGEKVDFNILPKNIQNSIRNYYGNNKDFYLEWDGTDLYYVYADDKLVNLISFYSDQDTYKYEYSLEWDFCGYRYCYDVDGNLLKSDKGYNLPTIIRALQYGDKLADTLEFISNDDDLSLCYMLNECNDFGTFDPQDLDLQGVAIVSQALREELEKSGQTSLLNMLNFDSSYQELLNIASLSVAIGDTKLAESVNDLRAEQSLGVQTQGSTEDNYIFRESQINQGREGDCWFLTGNISASYHAGIAKEINSCVEWDTENKLCNVKIQGKTYTLTFDEIISADFLSKGNYNLRALEIVAIKYFGMDVKNPMLQGGGLNYFVEFFCGEYAPQVNYLTNVDTIENHIKSGNYIGYVAVNPFASRSLVDSVKAEDTKTGKVIDLYYSHAYAVVGASDNYIYLKNPHNSDSVIKVKKDFFRNVLRYWDVYAPAFYMGLKKANTLQSGNNNANNSDNNIDLWEYSGYKYNDNIDGTVAPYTFNQGNSNNQNSTTNNNNTSNESTTNNYNNPGYTYNYGGQTYTGGGEGQQNGTHGAGGTQGSNGTQNPGDSKGTQGTNSNGTQMNGTQDPGNSNGTQGTNENGATHSNYQHESGEFTATWDGWTMSVNRSGDGINTIITNQPSVKDVNQILAEYSNKITEYYSNLNYNVENLRFDVFYDDKSHKFLISYSFDIPHSVPDFNLGNNLNNNNDLMNPFLAYDHSQDIASIDGAGNSTGGWANDLYDFAKRLVEIGFCQNLDESVNLLKEAFGLDKGAGYESEQILDALNKLNNAITDGFDFYDKTETPIKEKTFDDGNKQYIYADGGYEYYREDSLAILFNPNNNPPFVFNINAFIGSDGLVDTNALISNWSSCGLTITSNDDNYDDIVKVLSEMGVIAYTPTTTSSEKQNSGLQMSQNGVTPDFGNHINDINDQLLGLGKYSNSGPTVEDVFWQTYGTTGGMYVPGYGFIGSAEDLYWYNYRQAEQSRKSSGGGSGHYLSKNMDDLRVLKEDDGIEDNTATIENQKVLLMQSLLRMCGLKILTLKPEDGFQLGTNSNGSGILNRHDPKNYKAIL